MNVRRLPNQVLVRDTARRPAGVKLVVVGLPQYLDQVHIDSVRALVDAADLPVAVFSLS